MLWRSCSRLHAGSAHIQSQIGMVRTQSRVNGSEAWRIEQADSIDPRFDVTYLYRGNIYETAETSAAPQPNISVPSR